jgi:hypothetical protein
MQEDPDHIIIVPKSSALRLNKLQIDKIYDILKKKKEENNK